MAPENSYDPRYYCFRRCPPCKVHVIQMHPGRESRRFLKWLSTAENMTLGAPSAPHEGGYGYRDTHSRSFKYMKRNVRFNSGDNNVYEVPIEFRKASSTGRGVNLCCDDSSGVLVVCKSMPGIEELCRFLRYLDDSINGGSAMNLQQRSILVLFADWDKFFQNYHHMHPDKNANYFSLFIDILTKMGARAEENLMSCRLNSGGTAMFGICPVNQKPHVEDLALRYIYKFAHLMVTEPRYVSEYLDWERTLLLMRAARPRSPTLDETTEREICETSNSKPENGRPLGLRYQMHVGEADITRQGKGSRAKTLQFETEFEKIPIRDVIRR